MTATTARRPYLSPAERFRRQGGQLITARIDRDGRVWLHFVTMTALRDYRGAIELWPIASRQEQLGVVDPHDPFAYRDADRMVRQVGYAPVDDWTTIDTMPAARLRRIPETPRGTAPRGN